MFGSDTGTYWTPASHEDQAWYARFDDGRIGHHPKEYPGNLIRCVRTELCDPAGTCCDADGTACDHGCDVASGECWPDCNPASLRCEPDGTWTPDEVRLPGTTDIYLRCPLGQNWDVATGSCTGTAEEKTWCEAMGIPLAECLAHPPPSTYDDICKSTYGSDYRLPSQEELRTLLGDCDEGAQNGQPGYCDSCDASDSDASFACTGMFGSDTRTYWTPSSYNDYAWYARFEDGRVSRHHKEQTGVFVRCMRTEPCDPTDTCCNADGTACDHGCDVASGECWPDCNPAQHCCTEMGTWVSCPHGCDVSSGECWPDCNPAYWCCEPDGTWTPNEVRQPGTEGVFLRCPLGQTWDVLSCSCTGTAEEKTWCEAMGIPPAECLAHPPPSTYEDVCKSTYGSDYRLPWQDEFRELLGDCDEDAQNGQPGYCDSCDASDGDASFACTGMFGSDTRTYWTPASYNDYAWYARFEDGRVSRHPKEQTGVFVRCMRTEPCDPASTCCNADGTACDHGCNGTSCYPECNPLQNCCTERGTLETACPHGCDLVTGNCWQDCDPDALLFCCESDGTWNPAAEGCCIDEPGADCIAGFTNCTSRYTEHCHPTIGYVETTLNNLNNRDVNKDMFLTSGEFIDPSDPDVRNDFPFFGHRHLQSIQLYEIEGIVDHKYLAITMSGDEVNSGNISVVQTNEFGSTGGLIDKVVSQYVLDEDAGSDEYLKHYNHPGGTQIIGQYLFVALEDGIEPHTNARVGVWRVSPTWDQPPDFRYAFKVDTTDYHLSAVAVTKLNDGRYLVAACANHPDDEKGCETIEFHLSDKDSLEDDPEFSLYDTWKKSELRPSPDPYYWSDCSPQNIGMLVEQDGDIYLVMFGVKKPLPDPAGKDTCLSGLNDDYIFVYRLVQSNGEIKLVYVTKVDIHTGDPCNPISYIYSAVGSKNTGTNFAAGSGLWIHPQTSNDVAILAVEHFDSCNDPFHDGISRWGVTENWDYLVGIIK